MSEDFNTFMGELGQAVAIVLGSFDWTFILGLYAIVIFSGLFFSFARRAIALLTPPELPKPEPRPYKSPIIVPFYARRRDPNHPIRD